MTGKARGWSPRSTPGHRRQAGGKARPGGVTGPLRSVRRKLLRSKPKDEVVPAGAARPAARRRVLLPAVTSPTLRCVARRALGLVRCEDVVNNRLNDVSVHASAADA